MENTLCRARQVACCCVPSTAQSHCTGSTPRQAAATATRKWPNSSVLSTTPTVTVTATAAPTFVLTAAEQAEREANCSGQYAEQWKTHYAGQDRLRVATSFPPPSLTAPAALPVKPLPHGVYRVPPDMGMGMPPPPTSMDTAWLPVSPLSAEPGLSQYASTAQQDMLFLSRPTVTAPTQNMCSSPNHQMVSTLAPRGEHAQHS